MGVSRHRGWAHTSSSQPVESPGTLWDFAVCCRSQLPGGEEEAAAQGQRVCPGAATEPGPLLGSLGCCPKGFGPCPRATAAAAGEPAAGEAGLAGGARGGGEGPFPLQVPAHASGVGVSRVSLGWGEPTKSGKGWAWDAHGLLGVLSVTLVPAGQH